MGIAFFINTSNVLLAKFQLSISTALSSAGVEKSRFLGQGMLPGNKTMIPLIRKLRLSSGHFVTVLDGTTDLEYQE